MDFPDFRRRSPSSRRAFITRAASTWLGVSVGSSAFAAATGAQKVSPRKRPAKRIISLYMGGGMSQLESFSPCPEADAEIRGAGQAIRSSADGVLLGHGLPRTAKWMHRAVAFRSLSSNQGAHAEGEYFVKTNWRKRGTTTHPHLGSLADVLLGRENPDLPGFVSVSNGGGAVGAGYLGADHEALVVRDPEAGLANAQLRKSDQPEAAAHRRRLAEKLNESFVAANPSRPVLDHAAMFEATSKLMKSDDLKAFDVSEESPERRALYGSERFGLGCLLARRLSASGVRFVEVGLGGWDTHTDHFERTPGLFRALDRGLSALIEDLDASGELDETLITVSSEFGRTPKINVNAGRDHYPQAFSGLMVGGGILGGQVHGAVDRNGIEITEAPTDVTSFNATAGWAAGIPIQETVYSPSQRPFTYANEGAALTHLFSA